ncbi:MAG: UvrD-helicase domain-containing protein [Nitrospirota bacterium]|nr:MAG: UvrD-helicase domain-containing protein [Nitrospirota bacterium]
MRTDIIQPDNNIALRASAGSGKTYALSLRVINLLLRGVDPERILCITFTNKATNEMFQRIITVLKYLAFELSRSNLRDEARYILSARRSRGTGQELNADFSDDEITDLCQRSRNVYERVIRNLSGLRISTIDSFFNSILRLFPFEAGIMPDFEVLTDSKERKITFDAFEEYVRSMEGDIRLRKVVGDVITKSGKAINSPGTFFYPYFEKLLEMRIGVERLQEKLKVGLDDMQAEINNIGDIDISIRIEAKALAKRLRESCKDISRQGAGQIRKLEISDASDIASLKSISKDNYRDYQYFKKCNEDERATKLFKKIKKDLPFYLQARNDAYRRAILFLFHKFALYLDSAKKRANGLSFSDVVNKSYQLLVDNGMIEQESDYFYFRLDSSIDHLLIDEFQDTNFIQWLILKPFVDELTAGMGQREEPGSFFYVGDPKQSIYRFRGGESRLFDSVLKYYQGKIEQRALNRNYRSATSIVELVNRVFLSVSMEQDFDYEEQEAVREEEGFVQVSFINDDDFDNSGLEKYNRTLGSVRILLDKGFREEDITILCNTNRQCEEYAEFLLENKIKAVTEGSMTILHSEGVGAIIDILRYLSDPGQIIYILDFLFAVPGLLSEKERTSLIAGDKDTVIPGKINEKIKRIRSRIGLLPVVAIIRLIVDEFHLFPRFNNDPNILLLIDMALSSEMDENLSITRFLDFVREELEDIKASRTEAIHAVKVLTIHKAKGLEFPAVIVPELEIGLSVSAMETPLIFEYGDDLSVNNIFINERKELLDFNPGLLKAAEAERSMVLRDRLNQLYVALTRAQECLFVYVVVKPKDKAGDSAKKKLSDILYEAIGLEDHVRGMIPLRAKRQGATTGIKAKRRMMDETVDFIMSVKKGPEKSDTEEEERSGLSYENFRARRFGIAFHYAMESMRSYNKGSIADSIRRVKQRFGPELSEHDISSIETRISLLLDNDQFMDLMKGARTLRELTYLEEGKTWIADMVVIRSDNIVIVDFKTGFESDLIKKYEGQVKRYCELAAGESGLSAEGYICFALDDKIDIRKVV